MQHTSEPSTSATRRLAMIDALRGIAILCVLYHHSLRLLPGAELLGVGSLELPLWAPFSNGWLGVSLFFVLSGFVLQLPYVSGTRAMAGRSDVGRFYLRRARRLLPLFYFAIVFGFVFMTPVARRSWTDLLLFLTATFNFTPDTFFPRFNWVLWSLGVEIWMSLLFPLLWLAGRRFGAGRLFLAVALLSLAVRVYGHELPGAYRGNPLLNWVKDGPFGRLDDFVLGMWIATRFGERQAFSGGSVWAALLAGAALLYATAFLWDLVVLERIPGAIVPLLNNGFQLGCTLCVLALLSTRSAVLRWSFANPALQLLGMTCYSLYVWHGVALRGMVGRQATTEGLLAWGAVLPLLVFLSYRYIEFGHVRDTRSLFRTGRP